MSAPLHARIHTSHVNRMTDRCGNITLPQTSLVGGSNVLLSIGVSLHFTMVMFTSADLSWQIILDFMSDLIEFYVKKKKDCILMKVLD